MKDGGSGLVPYGEMINHKAHKEERICYEHLPERKVFCYQANADLQKGEEIFISYGENKTRFKIFFQYGFVMDPEIEIAGIEELSLTWSLVSVDHFYGTKLALQRSENGSKNYSIKPHYEDEDLGKMIAFSRFIVYDGDLDELKELVSEVEQEEPFFGETLGPISLDNEIKTHTFIYETLTRFEEQYP